MVQPMVAVMGIRIFERPIELIVCPHWSYLLEEYILTEIYAEILLDDL